MQTRERRIYAHYHALRRNKNKRTVCCEKHWISVAHHIWMPLARHWKMPIKEVKRIVAEEKERRALQGS